MTISPFRLVHMSIMSHTYTLVITAVLPVLFSPLVRTIRFSSHHCSRDHTILSVPSSDSSHFVPLTLPTPHPHPLPWSDFPLHRSLDTMSCNTICTPIFNLSSPGPVCCLALAHACCLTFAYTHPPHAPSATPSCCIGRFLRCLSHDATISPQRVPYFSSSSILVIPHFLFFSASRFGAIGPARRDLEVLL
ncbi:hypothetical protein OF83DRAFT_519627 [Amylostereum chailletii]|nr:hypothetical protein OF83DRAFT_519627 [Amylostereum chailletii]